MVVDVVDVEVEGCGDVGREGAEWKDVETSEASDSESDSSGFCSRSSTLARDSFLCVCEVLVILVIDVINF